MKLSELQKKDIINIKDGKKIGRVIDADLDMTNGNLIKFIIESPNFIKNLFTNQDEITIKFTQIKKLGEDVILIEKI